MKSKKRNPWRAQILGYSFAVIGVCEIFLISDVLSDMFYIDIATSWLDHDVLESVAVVALGVALVAIGYELLNLLREHRESRATVRAASGQLLSVIDAKFDDWGLTPSEREIALLLIKGFSVQEIGTFRATRPGTVKSQSNAIYRKASVSGRSELVAYFVEDLLAGENLVSQSNDSGGRTAGNDVP